MADDPTTWSEADSRDFLDLAEVAVPSRREQIEVIASLIPREAGEAFSLLDLGCGEGVLAERVLERFPRCRLLGLDGSDLMREKASGRLRRFGGRAEVRAFDLAGDEWLAGLPSPLHCVTASLVLHHTDAGRKRHLFHALRQRLVPGGALIIGDVIEPASDIVRRSFAALYDDVARGQSLAATGTLQAFETLTEEGWNAFASPDAVPGEMPSRLFEQLKWLEEAGFSTVDCFWMRCGHAIFGGYA